MDGVVVDSEPLYAQAEIKLFAEYGVSIPDEDWKLFRGCTEDGFYDIALDRYGIKEDRTVLMERGRQYVQAEFAASLNYMPGFSSLIGRIHQAGLKRGLVTSSPERMYRYVDGLLSVGLHFDDVIWGGMTENSKPHPEPYLSMMKKLDVIPDECLIIEDSLHGLNAAVASGAKVIALTGSVEIEDIPVVNQIVENLEDVTV